jgi:hypothetical protein
LTILFCAIFFAVGTVIMTIETVRLWRLSAQEIEDTFRGQWRSPLQRRMRMATPAGLVLGLAFDLLLGLVLVDSVAGDLPRWVVVGGLTVVVAAGIAAAAAIAVGWPRSLLLPAFRPREVYRRALAER